jgi:SAM-dependent methyltransferase
LAKSLVSRANMTMLAHLYHRLRYWITVIREGEGRQRKTCPACGYYGGFKAFGHPPRYNAECPNCGSLERHRLLCLAFERLGLLSEGKDKKLLHFAPEAIVGKMVSKYGVVYLTADLRPGFATLTLNMEKIDLPDSSIDVVMANHVLEHVDDRAALAEIHRILTPGGRLIATVPLIEGWMHTYENPEITSDADRDVHFGQFDHVRYYGRDFRDRVLAAGFTLDEYVGSGLEVVEYGLLRGERVFIGTRSRIA